MARILANAPHFLFNTDYKCDQVVYLTNGSFVVSGTSGSLTIPHELPFTPLPGGNWSTTTDFTVAYEFYTGNFPSGNINTPYEVETDITADDTNINLTVTNLSGAAKTIYYRIFGFQPSDDDSAIEPITTGLGAYILNTDNNIAKILDADKYDLPEGGDVDATYSIFHGLGYIPQVVAWTETSGIVKPLALSQSGLVVNPSLSVDENNLTFVVPAFDFARTAHYRIYMDS